MNKNQTLLGRIERIYLTAQFSAASPVRFRAATIHLIVLPAFIHLTNFAEMPLF
jgi:hypothetical protein